jgi:hypothetical protein
MRTGRRIRLEQDRATPLRARADVIRPGSLRSFPREPPARAAAPPNGRRSRGTRPRSRSEFSGILATDRSSRAKVGCPWSPSASAKSQVRRNCDSDINKIQSFKFVRERRRRGPRPPKLLNFFVRRADWPGHHEIGLNKNNWLRGAEIIGFTGLGFAGYRKAKSRHVGLSVASSIDQRTFGETAARRSFF